MATRYAVASGDWFNTSVWSTSSGGAGGASVPGIGDTAFFDSNSGLVTLTSTAEISVLQVALSISNYLDISSGGELRVRGAAAIRSDPNNSGVIRLLGLEPNMSQGATILSGETGVNLGKVIVEAPYLRLQDNSFTMDLEAVADDHNITITFEASTTHVFTGFTIDGDGSNKVYISGSIFNNQQRFFNVLSSATVRHLDIKNIANSGMVVDATDPTNNNSGNNSGFNFADFSSSSGSSVSISLSSSSTSSSSTSSTASTATSTSSNTPSSTSTSSLSSSSISSQSLSSQTVSTSTSSSSSSTSSSSEASTSTSSSSTSTSSTSSRTPSSTSTSSSSDSGTSSSSTSTSSTTSSSSPSTLTTETSTSSTSSETTSSRSSSTSTSDSTSASTQSTSSSQTTSATSSSTSTSEASTVTSLSSSSSESTSTTSCSSDSSTSSVSQSGESSSSLSTGSECYDVAPWLHLERQIKSILDADSELRRYAKDWESHVIIGIEDNMQPPRNGLAVPIVEFEVEDIADVHENFTDDALIHTVRFHLTDIIWNRNRHFIRNFARKLMRPLRQQFTRHENQFEFTVRDITEDGVYRFLDVIATITIWVTREDLNR